MGTDVQKKGWTERPRQVKYMFTESVGLLKCMRTYSRTTHESWMQNLTRCVRTLVLTLSSGREAYDLAQASRHLYHASTSPIKLLLLI